MLIFMSLLAVIFSGIFALIYCGRISFPASESPVPVRAIRVLPIVFILSDLLYVLPVSLQLFISGGFVQARNVDFQSYVDYFPYALLLNAVFLIVFSIFFKATVNSQRRALFRSAQLPGRPRLVFWLVWILFFITCIYMIASLSRGAGGIMGFILLGYGVTEQFNNSSIAVAGLPWLVTISLLYLVDAKERKSKPRLLVGFALLTVVILSFIIMGRRGALVGIGISCLVIYHFQYKRLGFKSLCVIVVSGFLMMNIIGLVRGSAYNNIEGAVSTLSDRLVTVTNDRELDLFYTLTKGNFVVPFQSMPNIISHTGDGVDLQWGGAALKGLALFIPQTVWSERPEALSNWYMREFIDSGASDNEGVQFFFLSGSYLDFGAFGPLLWGVLYGVGFATAGVWFIRRLHDPVYLTLFALFVGNMLNFISSDTVGGLVVFFKSAAAPCLLMIFFTFLTGKRSRSGGSHD